MSTQDYNTVRALTLHEIANNSAYRALVHQYALHYCNGAIRRSLLKLAGGEI